MAHKPKATTRDGYTATQMQNFCINKIQNDLGGVAWRSNTGALSIGKRFVRFGRVGSGDVIGFIPPNARFISIEIKTQNDDTSAEQEEFLLRVREAGGIAFIAESIADIDAGLDVDSQKGR
jgi:hypothetical protein